SKYRGDIVFGHHSHTMQGYEPINTAAGRTGAIFYSLGNFVHGGLSKKGDGMAVRIRVGRNGVTKEPIELIPLQNASTQPAPGGGFHLTKLQQILQQGHALLRRSPQQAACRWLGAREVKLTAPYPHIRIEQR